MTWISRFVPAATLGALALAASAGPVLAQAPVPEIMLPMPDMMGGLAGVPMLMMRPAAHIEGTLAFLKTEIGITAAQQPQWDAFANALRNAARDIQAEAVQVPTLIWPERLAHTEKLLTTRLAAVRSLEGPVDALYGALSDEQKRKADQLMAFPLRMF